MDPVTILVFVLLAPLYLINLVFAAEVLVGLPRQKKGGAGASSASTTIIMPAHNEARIIRRTLDRLMSEVGERYRILVVADNCDDDTAALARNAGAEVIERKDADRRGKGHALAFARQWLRQSPPEIAIVLDADCRTDRASLQNLAATCQRNGKPAQAINLLEPSLSAEPMVQVSTFAFLMKNLVRQRGLQRLTGGVHLTGTGMALPWTLFDRADLATSNVVEDIRLGLEMARSGKQPQLVQDSFVWSRHADMSDTLVQRSRWEGGFLATAQVASFAMILDGLKALRLRTVVAGMDLLIPPLALLAIINAGALLLTLLAGALGWAGWAPSLMILLLGTNMLAAVVAAWWREGRAVLSAAALLKIPLYALWKVPMYVRLLNAGAPSEWRRTGRPGEEDPET